MNKESSVSEVVETALMRCTPLNMLWEITRSCNLHCFHCYASPRSGKELSFCEVTGIADQLAEANCLVLTFSGGEALLRGDFLDIVEYCRLQGFAWKLFTNGTLIDAPVAKEMARLQPVEIGVSVYGADEGTHDRATGVHGSFARTMNGLELLKAEGVPTRIKCLLMKGNLDQIDGVRSLAQRLRAACSFDPMVSPRNDGDRAPLSKSLDEGGLEHLFSNVWPDMHARPIPSEQRLPWLICAAGRDTGAISATGQVYPCIAMPMSWGNLREETFNDIWYGAEAQSFRKHTFSDLDICAGCGYLPYCDRCGGLAFTESGGPWGPSRLNCRVARVRYQIAGRKERDGAQEAV